MSVKVRIATQLRSLSEGQREVTLEGETLGEVLNGLDAAYPGFAARLFDEGGELHPFVTVFVADEDARVLGGLKTPLAQGETISIVPAVAGG